MFSTGEEVILIPETDRRLNVLVRRDTFTDWLDCMMKTLWSIMGLKNRLVCRVSKTFYNVCAEMITFAMLSEVTNEKGPNLYIYITRLTGNCK